jgi:acyl-CoA reductase-like NAD-dependent aldehyde dehydrogenase
MATTKTTQGPLVRGETLPGGAVRDVVSPYDRRVVGRVADAGAGDVEAAVCAARDGAAAMRAMPAYERAAILERAAAILRRDRDPVAALITGESAKPIRDARGEVDRAIQTLTLSAEEAGRLGGEVVPMGVAAGGAGKVAWTRREPRGVIAAITPFNFPLNLAMHKVAPALASGNAVILKPAPATPLTGMRLGKILLDAGCPPEAVSVLPGGTEAAQALVAHPDVAMVSFTGSVPAGRSIQAAAPHKKVTLELGNAGAVVVAPDGDEERVLERCVPAAYAFAGQVCISVQRVFVPRARLSAFAERWFAAASALPVGDPFDEETRLSAMISAAAADRVEQWISEALAAGATAPLRGKRERNVLWPTVLCDAPPSARVSRDEVFGPVAVLYGYDDFNQALDAVNATPFGLQASVFTADLSTAMRAVDRLEMGTVLINEAPNFRLDAMPYGGVKSSGVGREGPRYAMADMTEPKLVILQP